MDNKEYKVTGAVFDADDHSELLHAVSKMWFTEDEYAKAFRGYICKKTNSRHSVLVNSGSSANLLAVTAIKDLYGDVDGKLVITCATAFPTTVAPLIQNRYIPYFIDIDPITLTYNYEEIFTLLERDDVAGVMLAHNLGIPYDEERLSIACRSFGKWLIADCCDALGSTVNGKHVGSYADCGTLSFFPAHHITTGEGGSVFTNSGHLFRLLQQYSNWGRDCYCVPGTDNTCNKRFEWEWDNLPKGFDHKYTFTKVGYNLKMTELQAALGYSQIQKLDKFIAKRRDNYRKIYDVMKKHDGLYWWLIELGGDTSPFGFYVLCNNSELKSELVEFLESKNIRTRPLFSGNILRHPMMKDVKYESSYIIGSNTVMEKAFWIGCWHGVTDENIKTLKEAIEEFIYG